MGRDQTTQERWRELFDYVHDKLHPRVHDAEADILSIKAWREVTDGRIQDLREKVSKFYKTIFGNGTVGLQEQINTLTKSLTTESATLRVYIDNKFEVNKTFIETKVNEIKLALGIVAPDDQTLSGRVFELEEWQRSINTRSWAVVMMFVGLVLERIWSHIP